MKGLRLYNIVLLQIKQREREEQVTQIIKAGWQ